MGEPCPPQANPWCSSHLPSCWPVRCRWHTWTRSLPPQDVAPTRPHWTLRKCTGGRWASPIAPHQSPPHPLQLARWIWESPSFVCRNWSEPSLHGVPLREFQHLQQATDPWKNVRNSRVGSSMSLWMFIWKSLSPCWPCFHHFHVEIARASRTIMPHLFRHGHDILSDAEAVHGDRASRDRGIV